MLDVNDPEVRRVVQRHLRAMLADLLLLAAAKPATAHTALYDPRTRLWTCPACRAFRDARRRAVTTHARFCSRTETRNLAQKASP